MDRRSFLGVVAATPIAAACRTADPATPSEAARDNEKLLDELRRFAVPSGVEPAMHFAPLRQP